MYFLLPPPSIAPHFCHHCYCPSPVVCCHHHLSSPSPMKCLIVVSSLMSSSSSSGVHHSLSCHLTFCHLSSSRSSPPPALHADCFVLTVSALVDLLCAVTAASSSSSSYPSPLLLPSSPSSRSTTSSEPRQATQASPATADVNFHRRLVIAYP